MLPDWRYSNLRYPRNFAGHDRNRRNGPEFLSRAEAAQRHVGEFDVDFRFAMARRDDEEFIDLRSLCRAKTERRDDPLD